MPPASYVRPMTTEEIYSAAFTLYRRHFGPLMVINLIYTLLVIALNFLNRPGLLRFGPTLPILTEMTQIFIYAVVVIAASNAVLGRPVRVAPAFKRAAAPRALLKILVFAIPLPLARALLAGLFPDQAGQTSNSLFYLEGLLLFLLAFAVRILFLFAAPVIVLEKRGLADTVVRAVQLSAAFAGQNFYRYGLFFVPFQILRSIAAGILPAAAAILATAFLAPGSVANLSSLSLFFMQQIPLGLVILLLNPLGNLVATLLYYDARARREQYHLEVLAEEMGYQPLTEMIAA